MRLKNKNMRPTKKHRGASPERRVLVWVQTDTGWGREIIRGIHRQARLKPGWRLRVEHGNAEATAFLPTGWAPDGVIARVANPRLAALLSAARLPVVNVSAINVPEAKCARVATDVEAAGRMAADYFLERGYKHFAYLSMIGLDYVAKQRRAFAGAVAKAGHGCAELSLEPVRSGIDEAAQEATLSRWLAALPKPVAVFTWSGGRELVHSCWAAGLAVPEEVALLSGSDDDLLCEVCDVPISAVRQPAEQIGGEAADLLERLMNGEAAPRAPRWLEPLTIVTRQSTETLAVNDRALVAALRFIRGTAGRPVQVAEVAAAAGVSRRVLERRFAAQLRASPADYLRRARLERAKALLEETDRPIPEVALAAGFGSPEYLAQAFRTELKISPLRFRRMARGREPDESRRGVAADRSRRIYAVQARAVWRWVPRPSIPSSITSPGFKYTGGFWPRPTPAGVPVEMTSPGRRVMNWLR
jgi:LacI family transcriptional regulator